MPRKKSTRKIAPKSAQPNRKEYRMQQPGLLAALEPKTPRQARLIKANRGDSFKLDAPDGCTSSGLLDRFIDVIKRCKGDTAEAARLIGLSPGYLRFLIRQAELPPDRRKQGHRGPGMKGALAFGFVGWERRFLKKA